MYEIVSPEHNWIALQAAAADQAAATELVLRRIGAEMAAEASEAVIQELAVAVREVGRDERSPVVHAANAVESFLVVLAARHSVNLQTANGIIQKANQLLGQHHLNKKLHGVAHYLGQVRNAADHGSTQM